MPLLPLSLSRSTPLGVTLGLSLMAASAMAKNVAVLQPVADVLQLQSTQQLLGPDLRFQYGSTAPTGRDQVLGELTVEGRTDPFGGDGAQRRAKGDERACRDAMKAAIAELVLRARKLGANALLNVQSQYQGAPLQHETAYECHVGLTRVVVGLKATAARTASTPEAKAAPVRAVATTHAYSLPPSTGFAAATDAKALPISLAGQAGYEKYLSLPAPKAFAILEDGGWRYQYGNGEAMAGVLNYCARQGRTCWLYAVDNQVVWSANPQERIGSPQQLRPASSATE